jgi:hypothetical protein
LERGYAGSLNRRHLSDYESGNWPLITSTLDQQELEQANQRYPLGAESHHWASAIAATVRRPDRNRLGSREFAAWGSAAAALWLEGAGVALERAGAGRPAALRQRRRTRYVFVSSLPSPSATLAATDEGAQTVTTEKATTEKWKLRVRREMLSPYEMSLV